MHPTLIVFLACTGAATCFAGSDTKTVVRALTGSSLLSDVTSDGHVTDIDIAIQIHGKLAGLTLVDLTGDGVVDFYDTRAAIITFITSTMGDIDKDGEIKVDDLLAFNAACGSEVESLLTKDVDGDGQITVADHVALIDKIFAAGDKDAGVGGSILADIMFDLGEVENYGAAAYTGIPLYSATHLTVITKEDWKSPANNHHTMTSWTWPDNHRYAITSGWSPGWGSHSYTSTTEIYPGFPMNPLLRPSLPPWDWPANHKYANSMTWNTPGHGHETATSALWKWHPNHRGDVSRTWVNHQTDTSRGWPANHDTTNSANRTIDTHRTDVSATWPEVNHTTALSSTWYPPNHEGQVSNSWPTGHAVGLSSNWPPNHLGDVSASWDQGEWRWPANHAKVDSATWYEPYQSPLPRIWPEGHTIIDSYQRIRDLLPAPTPPAN